MECKYCQMPYRKDHLKCRGCGVLLPGVTVEDLTEAVKENPDLWRILIKDNDEPSGRACST